MGVAEGDERLRAIVPMERASRNKENKGKEKSLAGQLHSGDGRKLQPRGFVFSVGCLFSLDPISLVTLKNGWTI
jgi:hypothetical protein